MADFPVMADPWRELSRFTPARIALGRTGSSLPTPAHLGFQLAHARARDAVHHRLDVARLEQALAGRRLQALTVQSAAADRATYLQRPDLGRQLDEASRQKLEPFRASPDAPYDLALVIADGLSAFAVEQNALPLLDCLLPRLRAGDWSLAPIVIAQQARVALGDQIALGLGARLVVILIGERPGLSSPDSLGVYLTWQPRQDSRDAERNCISNIRREGMSHAAGARTVHYLIGEARHRSLSGVALKGEAPPAEQANRPGTNFLTAS